MNKFDINQSQLDLGVQIEVQKTKRRNFFKEKKVTYFSDKQTSLDNLIKLTYDITDKDFEYFYAYILEKQGYTEVIIRGGLNDGGVDIQAYKDNKCYFIQCKQWANEYIDIKKAGEYFATIWETKKSHPDAVFRYITTSYIHYKAQDFFRGQGIEYIDNIPLIQLCEELKVFDINNWKDIKAAIYKKRIDQLSIRYKNPKEVLRQECIREFKNHLPENIRYRILGTYSQKHVNSITEYFSFNSYLD